MPLRRANIGDLYIYMHMFIVILGRVDLCESVNYASPGYDPKSALAKGQIAGH